MGSQPRKISGSRSAAILGFSKFATPLSVWQEIMEEENPGFNAEHGYILPEKADNASIRFGLAFEDAIAELSERATGKRITDREKFFERDFMTAHVDGIFENGVLYEAKTTSSFIFNNEWGEPNTDRIPRQYQTQIQHNLMLTGASEAVVSVLVFPDSPDNFEKIMNWYVMYLNDVKKWHLKRFDSEGYCCDTTSPERWADVLSQMGYFHQYPVKANPEAQRLMVEAYREFWHKNVLTGAPPEPRNYEDVKRLMPEPKKTIIVDEEMERWFAEIKGINEETKRANQRKDELSVKINRKGIRLSDSEGIEDDESLEALIYRNAQGIKLGQYAKQKDGKLVFRVS